MARFQDCHQPGRCTGHTAVLQELLNHQWTAADACIQYNNATEGYIDITVKDANGATLIGLLNASTTTGGYYNTLLKLNVSNQARGSGVQHPRPRTRTDVTVWQPRISIQFANWSTDATDTNGQYAYPPGTYTIYATSKLNGMNDNYKLGGADYTLKTVSSTVTVTLASDTVKIEANKDSVVRSKPFSVTVTGKPNTVYHVWVKGTSTMTGGYDNQPPMVKAAPGLRVNQLMSTRWPIVAPYPAPAVSTWSEP